MRMRYSRCGANGELLHTSKGQQRQVQEKDDLGDNGRHHADKDSGVLAALTLVGNFQKTATGACHYVKVAGR
jgi:hypothetical protein